MASKDDIRFASTIVRQEVHFGEVTRKELDERAVTFDVLRREFVYRDDSDGILTHVTIPCGEGCTQIISNRFIEVKMKRNCSKNLSVCFYPTDTSVLRELVEAVKDHIRRREPVAVARNSQTLRQYKRSRWDSRELFPSTGSEESLNGGSPAPKLLQTPSDEPNSTVTRFENSPKTALIPYRGSPQPQNFKPADSPIPYRGSPQPQNFKPADSPDISKKEQRSDIPVVKPNQGKQKPGRTGQSATSSTGSSESELATSFQTKLQRDKLQSIDLICSCKPMCAKKETKKCRCYKTGDIIHICMHCRYVIKLGDLGQFQCCGKKCSNSAQPALLEELIGPSNLVYRCRICGLSMQQVEQVS